MRALWLTSHGGISAFELRDAPDPEPRKGEVRIRARAIGLNFADLMASQGLYPGAPDPPCILGYEVAGVADAVGEGVDTSLVGARVIGSTAFGGHAEAACAPVRHVYRMPDSMSFEEGAALPVQSMTAYHILFHVAHVRPGESVLIHMAAGGVGTAALQLCRTVDGVVTFGTASAAKHAVLREYGCTYPIDYRTVDYESEVRRITNGAGVDVIMDPLGGDDWRKGYGLLKPGGRLVCYGFANLIVGDKRNWLRAIGQMRKVPKFKPLDMIAHNKTVAGVHLGRELGGSGLLDEEMREILKLYSSGLLKPRIDCALPLAQAHAAFERIRDGKNVGKVVLVV